MVSAIIIVLYPNAKMPCNKASLLNRFEVPVHQKPGKSFQEQKKNKQNQDNQVFFHQEIPGRLHVFRAFFYHVHKKYAHTVM